MNRPFQLLGASFVALTLFGAPIASAASSDQQDLVERASLTLNDLHKDKEFGNARDLMHKARAVLIVPRMLKGAFFVGGEGGGGVLLARSGGSWSQPAFYGVGSASFGFQFGVEQSELVLFIMSQKALDAVLKDNFKIGANAGIAVATLGSSVEGATTGNVGPDIVVWASSSGAYAGVSLNGSVIAPQHKDDAAYYGRPVTTADILFKHSVSSPGSANLRNAINSLN